MATNGLKSDWRNRLSMSVSGNYVPLRIDGVDRIPVVYHLEEAKFGFLFHIYLRGYGFMNAQHMRSCAYDALRQLGKNDDEYDREIFATVERMFSSSGFENGVDLFLMDLHRLEHDKIRDPFLVPDRFDPGSEDNLYTDRFGERTMARIAMNPKYWAFITDDDELLVYPKREYGVKFVKLVADETEKAKMERNLEARDRELLAKIPNAKLDV